VPTGALGDDDRVAGQGARHVHGGRFHESQIRVAITAPARRADREKHGVRLRYGPREIRGEAQAPAPHPPLDEVIEAGLVNGDLTAAKLFDLLRVHVHAGDGGAELGEACPRHQAYVAGPDHGNVHGSAPRKRSG
jgi:hypothetical protein